MDYQSFFWLIPLGVMVGFSGALVGLGGGFILVPLLLLLHPELEPEAITSISLAVIFVNGMSGSWAYARMRRIDYTAGLLFAVATIPGAVLGAQATAFLPRQTFELVFGVFLIAVAVLLVVKPRGKRKGGKTGKDGTGDTSLPPIEQIIEAHRSYAFTPPRIAIGVGSSVLVGFLSSLLGVGGGMLQIPIMLYLLQFPIHIATATSHFILSISSLSGSITHLVTGTLQEGLSMVVPLAIGVFVGAQIGAYTSNRMQGIWLVRALSLALGVVGIRFVMMALGHG